MKITLRSIKINSFKGIKSLKIEPEGHNATITAENGVGKTTVYDAFLWVLFGKNSEGVAQFGIVPYGADNKALKGLVVGVEAVLDLDGKQVSLKREKHEKLVKRQLKGYTDHFWVQDVPKKEKDYAEFIEKNLLPEDTFKVLTDLTHFNTKLHWKDRRAILMEIAGDVKVEDDTLSGLLDLVGEDRTIDEYKAILTGQKKGYDEERKEINPRIDELQRSLDEYASEDGVDEIAKNRDKLKAEIVEIDKHRKGVIDAENKRQEAIRQVNDIKLKRDTRAIELKNDTSGVTKLLEEKAKIEADVNDHLLKVVNIEASLDRIEGARVTLKHKLDVATRDIKELADNKMKITTGTLLSECPMCGQDATEEMVKDALRKINVQGKALRGEINEFKEELSKLEVKKAEATEAHEFAESAHSKVAGYKETRFAEIDKLIENRPTVQPKDDETWCALDASVTELSAKIGEPDSDIFAQLEDKRLTLSSDIEILNQTLANADTIAKNGNRIKELEAREKELAQKIADIEAQLSDIDRYKKAESELIEFAVNDKFDHTRFKLFDYRLNGEIKETCLATHNGVDYGDASTGQQIYIGIDVVNVLSGYYDMSVVLFIDHIESLTHPITANTQVIGLRAEKGVKELKVDIEKTTPEDIEKACATATSLFDTEGGGE